MSHVQKVAVIGGTGNVGSRILDSLLATKEFQVTVLTRPDSSATFPSDPAITVTKVDYSSEDSIAEALKGIDVLIISLATSVPKDLHPRICNAAAKAGVKYIMPNYFGYAVDGSADALRQDPVLAQFMTYLDDVRNLPQPGPQLIAICSGFWYDFSLALGEPWFGFDIPQRTVTFYDDGLRKINTSTWEQIGRAVAALLSLPETSTGDGKPALAEWSGKGLMMSSFLVSQRDILDSLNRVLGTTDSDWTITYENVEDRHARGLKEFGEGNFLGFARAMYARMFFKSGEGDYETGRKLDNEVLGLPKEDIDDATRNAIEMQKRREHGDDYNSTGLYSKKN